VPNTLAGSLTSGRAWSTMLAVGIRLCSGAIIVLVFAMSQQLYAAGLASVLAISLGATMTVSLLVLKMLTLSAKSAALRYCILERVAGCLRRAKRRSGGGHR
jgi:nickel/cobalt transporter (NicO) family protein